MDLDTELMCLSWTELVPPESVGVVNVFVSLMKNGPLKRRCTDEEEEDDRDDDEDEDDQDLI